MPDEPLAIPNGIAPLERVTSFEPGDVLGLQGQLWWSTSRRRKLVEWRAFPRLAAIAEIGWSGPGRDFTDLRSRFATHRRRLDAIDGVPLD